MTSSFLQEECDRHIRHLQQLKRDEQTLKLYKRHIGVGVYTGATGFAFFKLFSRTPWMGGLALMGALAVDNLNGLLLAPERDDPNDYGRYIRDYERLKIDMLGDHSTEEQRAFLNRKLALDRKVLNRE